MNIKTIKENGVEMAIVESDVELREGIYFSCLPRNRHWKIEYALKAGKKEEIRK